MLNRWRKYLRELLTAENYEPDKNINNADTVDIEGTNSNEPTIEELIAAAKKINNGKSARHDDGIGPEMIKNLGVQGAEVLLKICKKTWTNGKVSGDWLVPL